MRRTMHCWAWWTRSRVFDSDLPSPHSGGRGVGGEGDTPVYVSRSVRARNVNGKGDLKSAPLGLLLVGRLVGPGFELLGFLHHLLARARAILPGSIVLLAGEFRDVDVALQDSEIGIADDPVGGVRPLADIGDFRKRLIEIDAPMKPGMLPPSAIA